MSTPPAHLQLLSHYHRQVIILLDGLGPEREALSVRRCAKRLGMTEDRIEQLAAEGRARLAEIAAPPLAPKPPPPEPTIADALAALPLPKKPVVPDRRLAVRIVREPSPEPYRSPFLPEKKPPKDENLCRRSGCMNPRRKHAFGRVVAFCDQHCDEINAYHKARYAAKNAGKPRGQAGRKPRPPKDPSICQNKDCTRPRKSWGPGDHLNRFCTECSAEVARRSRERYAASHPSEPPEVERQRHLMQLQGILDKMVEREQLVIVGERDGEKLYSLPKQ